MAIKNTHRTAFTQPQLIRRLFAFIKPYRLVFYVLICLTIVLGILEPSRPYMVQLALDQYVALRDYQGLVKILCWMVGLLIAQTATQYALSYLSDWFGQHIVRDIRIKIYTHVLHLNTAFHTKNSIGRLITRNITDTDRLSDAFSHDLAAVLADLLQIIGIAAFMLYIDWKLALCSLTIVPLMLLATYLFKEKIKYVYRAIADAAMRLNTFVQSRLTGMRIIQIFNQEAAELKKFQDLTHVYRQAHDQSNKYYSLYFPTLELIRSVGIGALIYYGARDVVGGKITLGSLTAFLMYIKMLFKPISHLAEHFNTLQMGLVSADRIMELLDTQAVVPNHATYQPQQVQGHVSFEGVWFAYERTDYILKNISFELPAKRSLAIVGATGAGKSTIINLLERFYEPLQGSIRIDGVNIADYEVHNLRRHMGVFLQDAFLFSATIHENITLGNDTIAREQVIEAAQLIGLHDFVQQLPDGYDHPIQERGMTLSMGQKQLLAFARVLVYNPSIIILDEATASLDTATEQLVQQATLKLLANRTAIIIAHRLTTIQHADQIMVLDHGEVQEVGTHESLLAKGGYYAGLCQVAGRSK